MAQKKKTENLKTIVCYGDSNTWGFLPVTEDTDRENQARYPEDIRWPTVMARLLGDGYRVREEGLNGRTTALTDILSKYRNGAKYLGVCLSTAKPLDLLIIMLGSNDTKNYMRASSEHIGRGVEKLVKIARAEGYGPDGAPPKILIITPAYIREAALGSPLGLEFDENSIQKSRELAGIYYEIARRYDCYYMNAAVYVEASKVDGLHLDAKNHKKLADAIATKVREIFETDKTSQ